MEKAGQLDTVILSAEEYPALQANHDKARRAARKKTFESEFGDWIPLRTPASKHTAFLVPTCARGERSMAQYDVYTNPSSSATTGIPYVVVIQSDLLDALATRLTIPLAVPDVTTKVPTALCPVVMVKGERLHALAHYAAPLPAKVLRRPVDNVASQVNALVSAIDAVLSGI